MIREIRELQAQLGMSNGELLSLARQISGYAGLRCVDEVIAVDVHELLCDLQYMAGIDHAASKLVAV